MGNTYIHGLDEWEKKMQIWVVWSREGRQGVGERMNIVKHYKAHKKL